MRDHPGLSEQLTAFTTETVSDSLSREPWDWIVWFGGAAAISALLTADGAPLGLGLACVGALAVVAAFRDAMQNGDWLRRHSADLRNEHRKPGWLTRVRSAAFWTAAFAAWAGFIGMSYFVGRLIADVAG